MTDAPSMAGKYMLVTGGTGGTGKATATGPAALESPAVIRAAPRLPRPTSAPRRAPRRADIFAADMSAQAEVCRLAAQVLGTYPRLNVLVNNAGGF